MVSIVFIGFCYAINFPFYSKRKHCLCPNLYTYLQGKSVVWVCLPVSLCVFMDLTCLSIEMVFAVTGILNFI